MTTHVPRTPRASTARGSERSRETLRILTENITSGRWPLNSRIPTESELMAELGVGRSTLREAVSSLTALGMLEPARSRGTFVRSLSPVSAVLSDFIGRHENPEILQVRRLLEVESTRLAALLRTDEQVERLAAAHERDLNDDQSQGVVRGATPGEFHAIILEAAGNSLMADLHAGLMRGVRTAMARGEMVPQISAAERLADHGRILDAIREQDPVRAAQAAADHVDHDLTTAG
ncbi:FadR family transcriptional regulator [Aeromicrobium sp. Marseille-Q0843]|uniref:FadR family transcriptional regulator n=1 Tax=Aeromicrobium phoceense TaxID=2754045 RepID=A0A838XM24_9ACTN|nr:FCD domain-containing protein [Aeromicrobium phoceense]MBA4609828.1 FadR family transcriptional regulator [Aeromicrobium phoceense]